MKQEYDAMVSGERPGRYYVENELGVYNPQRIQRADKGITAGGHWYGVRTMRTMLPWMRETKFSPSDVGRALKIEGLQRRRRNRVWRSAAAFVRRERRSRD